MKENEMSSKALDKLVTVIKAYSDLDEKKLRKMVEHIDVEIYKRGTVLIEQGELVKKCFFIIEGCARQYSIAEDGKEVTSEFFTEKQSIVIFGANENLVSPYSVACIEDTIMIVGDLNDEANALERYPEFERIVLKMIQEGMGILQASFTTFIRLAPKERVKHLMDKRPELFTRVPQHQLASYLGITPESLSRIKGRLEHDYLKQVD